MKLVDHTSGSMSARANRHVCDSRRDAACSGSQESLLTFKRRVVKGTVRPQIKKLWSRLLAPGGRTFFYLVVKRGGGVPSCSLCLTTHGAEAPLPSVCSHDSPSGPLNSVRGPGTRTQSRPLFPTVVVLRHLPLKTDGAGWRCVTERGNVCERVCHNVFKAESLSAQILITLSTCSLQSHDPSCSPSGWSHVGRVCVSGQMCVSALSAARGRDPADSAGSPPAHVAAVCSKPNHQSLKPQ